MKSILQKTTRVIGTTTKNIVCGVKNVFFRAIGRPLKPTKIVYMVTDQCNSRCAHCNIWKSNAAQNPLSPPELEKALSDPLFKDVNTIICTGGEPATRKDLGEIVAGIHRALPKATIQLSTNGLLPERVLEVVTTALKQDICLDVGVSLDGIGDAHDKIRGIKGNFKKADGLIKELVRLRKTYRDQLHIAVGIVLSELTLSSLPQVRSYTKDLDIDLTEAWYNEADFYDNRGTPYYSKNLIDAVKSQLPSPLQSTWSKGLKGKPIVFPCFAMHTFCVLQCDGGIVPCLTHWNSVAGNVRDASPSLIWESMQSERTRQIVKNCRGCLNSWGAGWSFEASYYRILFFYLKHPRLALDKLRNRSG